MSIKSHTPFSWCQSRLTTNSEREQTALPLFVCFLLLMPHQSCTGILISTESRARRSWADDRRPPARRYLGDVVDEVLVALLRVDLAQLGQTLQAALDLVLLALEGQAVVHHRLGLLHLLGGLGVADGSPLHGALILRFLCGEKGGRGGETCGERRGRSPTSRRPLKVGRSAGCSPARARPRSPGSP